MKSRKLIICIVFLILMFVLLKPYIHSQRVYTAEELGIKEIYSLTDADGDGVDDCHDIMLGARAYVQTKPKYKSVYYDGGYPTDEYGVCTDVVWKGFAAAGYNLKELIDMDIAEYPEAYTSIEEADPNIDFRRVKNLKIFFDRNAEVLTLNLDDPESWQPGDIAVFDGHIAICSDKRNSNGIPFIIHHSHLGAKEANDMGSYNLTGHYRWTK